MSEDHDPKAAAAEALKALGVEPYAVSPAVAAAFAGIGRTRLYELLGSGEIPSAKHGARTLIRLDDVRSWIDRQVGEELVS